MAALMNTKDLEVQGLCIRVAELAVSPELNGMKKRWFADHRFSLSSGEDLTVVIRWTLRLPMIEK